MRYLIPIASKDEMFPRKEYHFPKPLVEIDGTPMIELVVKSITRFDPHAEFIFVVNRQDCVEFSLDKTLELCCSGNCSVIQLEKTTAGALCSCLLAIELINDEKPLVVVNGDQIILSDITRAISTFSRRGAATGVITFESVHPRWSFVRTDANGDILEAAEKRVLSRRAIAGFYYFAAGEKFIEAAKRVVLTGQSVNGVYYISSAINQIILMGGVAAYYDIREADYHSFYSPQRIDYYRKHRVGPTEKERLVSTHLQILIPMAGLGSRFSAAGYDKPKPFISVLGRTMIENVMDNLSIPGAKFILVGRQEHLAAEADVCKSLEASGIVEFSPIDNVTEGAACTVLTARARLNGDAPLLTANCDQIIDFNCSDFIKDAVDRDLDGSILVFRDSLRDPKWSFAKVNDEGLVVEVREKVAISDLATVGLYYFKTANDFIFNAIDMIVKNDRVNNEFYVCPVYNYMIDKGKRVGVYEIDVMSMHGIGTPTDLEAYIKLATEEI